VSIRRFALVAMVVVVGIAVVAVTAVGRGWVSRPALGAVPSAAVVAASPDGVRHRDDRSARS
jgi:hypothetical protein